MGIIRTAVAMAADKTFGPQFLTSIDFTLLFEQSILTLLPSVLLILSCPASVYHYARQAVVVNTGKILWAKLSIVFALVGIELTSTVIWSRQQQYRTDLAVVAAAFVCIGCAILGALLFVEHRHTFRASGILAMFLIATIIFDGAKARTHFTRTGLTSIGGLYIVSMVLKAILVILGEVSKKPLIRDPKTREKINPEATSGFWNRVFFFWINKTMFKGFNTFLHIKDLPDLETEFSSDHIHVHFHKQWSKADHSKPDILAKISLYCFWHSHLAVVFPRLLLSAFTFSQPFVLEATVRSISKDNEASNDRYWLIAATALVYAGIASSKALSEHYINRSITLLRGALNGELLDKSLKVTFKQAKESAAVSLMSCDVEGVFDAVRTLHTLWSGFIDVGVGFFLLVRLVKQSAFFTVLPSLLAFLATLGLSARLIPATKLWNKNLQIRISETVRFLAQLKAVKMTGLSGIMLQYIGDLRRTEIKSSVQKRQLWIVIHTISAIAQAAIPVCVIAGGVFWSGFVGGFNSANVFSLLSIITIVSEPIVTLPYIIPDFAAALACCHRIQEFLVLPERQDNRIIGSRLQSTDTSVETTSVEEQVGSTTSKKVHDIFPANCAIACRDVTLQHEGTERPLLTGINMEVLKAELNILAGPVGCGKTSFLEALLGELAHRTGSIYVSNPRIAYCSQTPFIQNMSIRQNIIGHRPLDLPWYNTVVKACELGPDFNQMKFRDHTRPGSDGVRLSGGQKQRIAAAQVAYALTEIMIFDNPFSALDPQTSSKIFANLFAEGTGLLRQQGITIILATPTVEFFGAGDRLHVLDGKGSMKTCSDMTELIQFSQSIPHLNLLPTASGKKTQRSGNDTRSTSTTQSNAREPTELDALDDEMMDLDNSARKLGDRGCYTFLLKAIPIQVYIVWISFVIITAILERSLDIYVRVWLEKAPDKKLYFLGLPVCLTLFAIFHTGWYWQFYSALVPRLAINMHDKLLVAILRADMTYVTSKDTGVMLNRFCQDMTFVNTLLPAALLQVTFSSAAVLISLGLIASGSSYTAVIIPFFIAAIYGIIRFYLRTSRQMRLLDLEGKTPLYTHFTETTTGLRHIRSQGRQEEFLREGLCKLDNAQKPYYYMLCIQRWLTLVLDMLVLAIAVLLESMALRFAGQTSESALGLALLNLITFASQIQRCFISWTSMETSLGVVSRLRSLTENAPLEDDMPPPDELLPNWPDKGCVTFSNVALSYSLPGNPAEPVLEGVQCSLFPGARVELTGRTGSGKSSFILALLNLIDRKGIIDIDGFDPKQIPPHLLRSRITTISQDPAQLPGTVRDNLIPYDLVVPLGTSRVEDSEIIAILSNLFIWEHIRANGGLDVSYSNMNFSHGQRQLVALAGAILHNRLTDTKLVIMDEATSHLDYDTDDKVQAYLVDAFGKSTVISVNHRDKSLPEADYTLEFVGGELETVFCHEERATQATNQHNAAQNQARFNDLQQLQRDMEEILENEKRRGSTPTVTDTYTDTYSDRSGQRGGSGPRNGYSDDGEKEEQLARARRLASKRRHKRSHSDSPPAAPVSFIPISPTDYGVRWNDPPPEYPLDMDEMTIPIGISVHDLPAQSKYRHRPSSWEERDEPEFDAELHSPRLVGIEHIPSSSSESPRAESCSNSSSPRSREHNGEQSPGNTAARDAARDATLAKLIGAAEAPEPVSVRNSHDPNFILPSSRYSRPRAGVVALRDNGELHGQRSGESSSAQAPLTKADPTPRVTSTMEPLSEVTRKNQGKTQEVSIYPSETQEQPLYGKRSRLERQVAHAENRVDLLSKSVETLGETYNSQLALRAKLESRQEVTAGQIAQTKSTERQYSEQLRREEEALVAQEGNVEEAKRKHTESLHNLATVKTLMRTCPEHSSQSLWHERELELLDILPETMKHSHTQHRALDDIKEVVRVSSNKVANIRQHIEKLEGIKRTRQRQINRERLLEPGMRFRWQNAQEDLEKAQCKLYDVRQEYEAWLIAGGQLQEDYMNAQNKRRQGHGHGLDSNEEQRMDKGKGKAVYEAPESETDLAASSRQGQTLHSRLAQLDADDETDRDSEGFTIFEL